MYQETRPKAENKKQDRLLDCTWFLRSVPTVGALGLCLVRPPTVAVEADVVRCGPAGATEAGRARRATEPVAAVMPETSRQQDRQHKGGRGG